MVDVYLLECLVKFMEKLKPNESYVKITTEKFKPN